MHFVPFAAYMIHILTCLDRLTCTQPDIIKIDRSLVTGIDKDYNIQEAFRSLPGLSAKIGALTIAEIT